MVLKEQVAAFFEVTVRTVENYLAQFEEELKRNGYEVLKGKRLKALKLALQAKNVPETDFGNIAKSPQLGIFDFRAFLNLINDLFQGLFFVGHAKGVQSAG